MMDPSDQINAVDNQPPSPIPLEDDDTVATPPKGEKRKPRGSIYEEKTLKFRFPPPKDNDGNVNPLILHVHWMHEVQTAFGDSVLFFDNNNRKTGKLDPLRTTPESQTHYFSVHNVYNAKNRNKEEDSQEQGHETNSNPTRLIVHRIQSKLTLSEIKNAPNVANLMRKYDFYVNDHKWSETDWDTIQLGFFYGLNPQFYDLDHATSKIHEVIKKNVPRMKVPKFRLVYCSPKVRTTRGNNRKISTKAYAIETLRKDRDEMTHILKQAYKETGTFVPFQMRSRHPEAFEKMIRAQTQLLANDFVIIMNHVGPDVMHYISERIRATDGVQDVLPCKSVNKDGRYKILVKKGQYHATRERFMEKLSVWINDHAAPDAKATLVKYQGPPEVAPISSDGFSRGENSYMIISVNTALSIGSAISDTSPPRYVFQDKSPSLSEASTLGGSRAFSSDGTRTWADRAAGRGSFVTDKPIVGQPSMDQSTIISDLASSRAEVENLKSKVAQLEAERDEHQKALAETVQEQVSKAVQDQMTIFTAQMTHMFASLVSTLQQPPGSVPKRTVHALEVEDFNDGDSKQPGDNLSNSNASSKRWDNKKTPNKQLQMLFETDTAEWQTPDSTPRQKSSSREDCNAVQLIQQEVGLLPMTAVDEVNMSQSEDDDITMQDSGNESKPKSLTSLLEAEASR